MRLNADQNEDVAGVPDIGWGIDSSLKTFYYQGGYLSIYEGRNEKLKRYYVTPLTEINIESLKCYEPGFEKRHKVRFNVEIWRSEVADEAVKALASPPLNLEVHKELVHPLPITQIRISTHDFPPEYEPDTVWKSNLNQRLQYPFTIYAKSKEACERMVSEIKEDPVGFASLIQIEIAMSAEQRASREISITGANIGRSKMFAQLQNMDQTNGERLLTSSDLNELAQEIVSSVVASEITKGAYVDKPDQVSFASLLEHQLSSGTIDSKQLSADQWKSVFWQEEFIRPDHYTKYLNHTLQYDQGTNKFSFDNETESEARKHVASDLKKDSSNSNSWSAEAKASFLGFGGSAGGSSTNTNTQSSQDKNEFDVDDKGRLTMSLDQLQKFLNKRDLQVEWSGDVFVPKSLDLHRVNTAELRYKSTIATQQIQVKTVPITAKLDATVASTGELGTIGRDHVKILIDQAKNEMNETMNQLAQKISDVNERVNEKINHTENSVERLVTDLQAHLSDQMTMQQQQINEEINETKLHLQEELLQQDAAQKKSISGQAAEIATIRSDVTGLKQPKTANCGTYYTNYDLDGGGNALYLDRHIVKCPRREQYMIEWHLERGHIKGNSPFGDFPANLNAYRFRIVCCNL
uniref:Uncharacterized protein n=1 Tax=Plectus sambesii TaxID=2011161 RepID=A0A914W7C5_9BILA